MKSDIINTINENKLIVILRGIAEDKILATAKALYDGGIRVIEVTYMPNGSVSDEETAKTIKLLNDKFGDKMVIGAGTVLTPKQVKLTYDAGGKLIVSPNINKKVIRKTLHYNMVSIPGAFTPSEIADAYENGADFIKVFPAGNAGVGYFKSVKTPLCHIPMLAVGGITRENIEAFYKAGAKGFGISSSIADRYCIDEGNYAAIERKAKEFVDIIKKL